MIDGHAAFAHHLLQIAITDPIPAVPPNRPEDDLTFKLTTFEIRHYPIRPAFSPFSRGYQKFATEPQVLPLATSVLRTFREPEKKIVMQNLAYRGLRFASPASNGFIGELLSDSYFEVDPDALVDSAVSKESAPERISDNLTLLNEAPGPLRGEMLRYVDNISIRLSENSPEKLTERGILAWAELIRGSDTVNPNRLNRQINIPVSLVTFAVRDTNASPTISIDKTGYIVANHTGHSLVESNYQGIQHLTCVVVSAPNTYYGGRLHWSRPTQGRRDNRLGRVHSIEALRR